MKEQKSKGKDKGLFSVFDFKSKDKGKDHEKGKGGYATYEVPTVYAAPLTYNAPVPQGSYGPPPESVELHSPAFGVTYL